MKPTERADDERWMPLVLPRGITGFYGGRREPPPPTLDPRLFVAACHTVARLAGGAVARLDLLPTLGPRNYHAATLQLPSGTLDLLVNAHHPLVALVAPAASRQGHWQFTESAELTPIIRATTAFTLPPLAALRAAPTPAHLATLAPSERAQIRHQKPAQLGDIIFNDWG